MKKLTYIVFLWAVTLFACSDDDLLSESGMTSTEFDDASVVSNRFCWVKSADRSSRSTFLRNFGVGYSYDAVNGEYCNWEDIRCQIINRSAVERFSEEDLVYHDSGINTLSVSSKFSYSKHDYVVAIVMDTKEETDLGIYNAEKRKRHYVLEDGVQESFYYTHDETYTLASLAFDAAGVIEQCGTEYENNHFLTKSFIDAVLHLSNQPVASFASVDSFINVYGTHVITAASIGGQLRVDLKNDMFRYNDKVKDSEWTTEELFGAAENKEQHRQAEDYRWLESGQLYLTARGGDQSMLTSLLGEHKYDGTRTFSLDGISKWRNSLCYDPNDDANSNAELIAMQVLPIWEFVEIIDDEVALRVKSAVQRDVSIALKLLGDRNFFSTKFKATYTDAQCHYKKNNTNVLYTATDSEDAPLVVNIEAGGRYVATVCHEQIGSQWMWVAYPIYEGVIKRACGRGIADDGSTWDICWIGNSCAARKLKYTVIPDETSFYISGGAIGITPQEGITYEESHAIPYIELCGGIQPDGSARGTAFPVRNCNGEFRIDAPASVSPSFVGWHYDNTDQCWKQDSTYTFIYNPKEISY